MKSIGTTSDGKILLEATPQELSTIDAAIVTLMEWRVMCEAQQMAPATISRPAPQAPGAEPDRDTSGGRRKIGQPAQPAPKPVGRPSQPKDGPKTCSICNTTKAATDFYDKGRQCKSCLAQRAANRYAAKHGKPAPAKPTGGNDRFATKPLAPLKAAAMTKEQRLAAIKAADQRVRDRDPVLDRPTDGGRVLPVGGEG